MFGCTIAASMQRKTSFGGPHVIRVILGNEGSDIVIMVALVERFGERTKMDDVACVKNRH